MNGNLGVPLLPANQESRRLHALSTGRRGLFVMIIFGEVSIPAEGKMRWGGLQTASLGTRAALAVCSGLEKAFDLNLGASHGGWKRPFRAL